MSLAASASKTATYACTTFRRGLRPLRRIASARCSNRLAGLSLRRIFLFVGNAKLCNSPAALRKRRECEVRSRGWISLLPLKPRDSQIARPLRPGLEHHH